MKQKVKDFKMKLKYCKCGCGEEIKIKTHHKYSGVPDYIQNHHLKFIGFKKGNKIHLGIKQSKEWIEKRVKTRIERDNYKGHKAWNINTPCNEKTKQKISDTKIKGWKSGKYKLNYSNFRKRNIPHNKGQKKRIILNCTKCNNEFKVIPYYKDKQKYCSRKCGNTSPMSNFGKQKLSERQKGENNVSKRPEVREKQRIIRQKQILKMGGGPNHGEHEDGILNHMQEFCLWEIKRQYPVCGYWVDGYIPELNLVIEIDEKPKINERDIRRENEIKEELNCKFLRIKDY